MKLEQKTRELLEIADAYRAEHCQALLAKAAAETRAILEAAHVAARHHLRAELAPQHARLRAEIAAAEATLVTQRRLRNQRYLAAILRQAWPQMVQALRGQWETPAQRTSWVMHHLAIALAAMPAEGWRIQHPEDWPASEREQAGQWLQAQGNVSAEFEADAGLTAGIRVVCGLNLLDASLDGLLADRTQIEGRLLHYLEQER
ncbi:MAG: hypothetical protein HY847_13905 [Betaproteobacteria bacterium]|nr:hypothetical protein [Betaproteobacteria bacterium]